jgi:hypothetical protein
MNNFWRYRTAKGCFRIVARLDSVESWFEEERLGTYELVGDAIRELVSDNKVWPGCGMPSVLGVPDDLLKWEFVELRRKQVRPPVI